MRQYRWMRAAVLAAGIMASSVMAQALQTEAYAAVRRSAGAAVETEDRGPGVLGTDQSGAGTGELGADAAASGTDAGAVERVHAAPAVSDGVIRPENLEGAKDADQLIVVVGTGGCHADTYYYKKSGDTWNLEWKEASVVGRGGITAQKAEGDGKTPAGTYGFTMAFGLKEDPGSILPYHKIVKGDYWVDDASNPYYNKLVNTSVTPKTWNSAENLMAASPYYNYALALDYNQDCVPGKGSAIFLHCFTASADNGSAGCIRLPEARARELVQSATGQTRIVIAENLESLK